MEQESDLAVPAARMVSIALREVQRAGLDARRALARRLGLKLSDVNALDQIIFSAEPLGPAELGARLGMRSASATILADRLERAGHIKRIPHPHDRRRQSLVLTEHARAEVAAALRPMLAALEETAAELTRAQADTVFSYLTRAAKVMRDYARDPAAAEQDSDPGTFTG